MWLKVMLVSLFGFSSILSSDLGGATSGNCMADVPLERSLGVGEFDTNGVCSRRGKACQNCTFAVTCVPLPVGWLKIPLEHCPEGKTCNADLQKCSEETAPECDAETPVYHHICEQIGIFPDLYDCRKFHLCSPPEGLPDGRPAVHRVAVCPRNYGYDPDSAQCSRTLENGKCPKRTLPSCTYVDESKLVLFSNYYYSVCLSKHGKLYHQIFLCPNGRNFWHCKPDPGVKTSKNTTE